MRTVFISSEGWSLNSGPWSEPECRPHPIPHPMIRGISHASTSQAKRPHCFDGFLEPLLTYNDLPKSPRFPFLSTAPYWDLYKYLCNYPTPSLSIPFRGQSVSLFPALSFTSRPRLSALWPINNMVRSNRFPLMILLIDSEL